MSSYYYLKPVHSNEECTQYTLTQLAASSVSIISYDEDGSPKTLGTGFFISKEGDIVTSRIILKDQSRAYIRTIDGNLFQLNNVYYVDKEADIVRASVDIPTGIIAPLFINVSIPRVGEEILIISNQEDFNKQDLIITAAAVRNLPLFGTIIQLSPISPDILFDMIQAIRINGSIAINLKGEFIGMTMFLFDKGQKYRFVISHDRLFKLHGGPFNQNIPIYISNAQDSYKEGLYSLWVGNYEKALSYFEKATREDPNFFNAHYLLGYCNEILEYIEESIIAYKRAAKIDPYHGETHFRLGLLYDKYEDDEESIEAFNEAIRIYNNLCEVYKFNIVSLYKEIARRLENYSCEDAIEAYKQLFNIKPEIKTLFDLGKLYLKLEKWREAAIVFTIASFCAKHEHINGNIKTSIFDILTNQEDIPSRLLLELVFDDLRILESLFETRNNYIRIKVRKEINSFCAGLKALLDGKVSESIKFFKKAILFNPYFEEPYLLLGIAYVATNSKRSMSRLYKKLKSIGGRLQVELQEIMYIMDDLYG